MYSNVFPKMGSWSRNLKRFAVVGALLFSGQMAETRAEVSHYKMRIHKNFIKDIIDKNFQVILNHIESKVERNVFLDEVNANIDNLDLKIVPKSGGEWDNLQSDLFFDQGQIVTELSNLEFKGTGVITDPETGMKEDIELRAALDLCQMVLSLEQSIDDGNVYPQVGISEVAFTLLPDEFIVNAQGDLPVYKSRTFEEGLKKWMIKELSKREKDFKIALQKSERDIMNSFAFKQEIHHGNVAHSTLSETMALEGDHVTLTFDTTFEGPDLKQVKKQMREVNPAYSDDGEHMRDVQVVVDENYINYLLYNLYHRDRVFSVAEKLFDWMPETAMGGGTAIRALMSTQIWSFFFPELAEFKKGSRLDFKCGFNKDYLITGQLEHVEISQVQFEEGDHVGIDLHFGCNLNVLEETAEKSDMEALMDLFKDFHNVGDAKAAWTTYRSVFMSLYFKASFDFSDDAKKINTMGLTSEDYTFSEGMPIAFGKILDLNVHVDELKIYKGTTAQSEEAHYINSLIHEGKDLYRNSGFKTLLDTFWSAGMPVAPFPIVEHCLGLSPKDSSMSIKDGYAVMAFDYNVDKADDDCLFNMGKTYGAQKGKKEVRMIDKLMKMAGGRKGADKMKDVLKNIKADVLKTVSGGFMDMDIGEIDIPDLPFTVPEFEIGGLKINLNDKEKINAGLNAAKDFVQSDQAKGILKMMGLG